MENTITLFGYKKQLDGSETLKNIGATLPFTGLVLAFFMLGMQSIFNWSFIPVVIIGLATISIACAAGWFSLLLRDKLLQQELIINGFTTPRFVAKIDYLLRVINKLKTTLSGFETRYQNSLEIISNLRLERDSLLTEVEELRDIRNKNNNISEKISEMLDEIEEMIFIEEARRGLGSYAGMPSFREEYPYKTTTILDTAVKEIMEIAANPWSYNHNTTTTRCWPPLYKDDTYKN